MKKIPENKLSVIIDESGLESTKAQILLEKFSDYFQIASDWEKKARLIKVTKEDQVTDMKMARTGRLFLRDKRIAIENVRKELKEQSLREGKAIDGIANVLKAVIVPIEKYLDSQEHFVEIQEAKRQERLRIEAEEKAEKERLLKEKQEAEERERLRKENEKLQKELEEKAVIAKKDREDSERKLNEEKEKAEKARMKAQKAIDEEKALVEKEKKEKKLLLEQKASSDIRQKELSEKLEKMIECPNCHHKFVLNNSSNNNE